MTLSPAQAIEKGYTHFVECYGNGKNYHAYDDEVRKISDLIIYLKSTIEAGWYTYAIIYIKAK